MISVYEGGSPVSGYIGTPTCSWPGHTFKPGVATHFNVEFLEEYTYAPTSTSVPSSVDFTLTMTATQPTGTHVNVYSGSIPT
jgi:hypothetical protein